MTRFTRLACLTSVLAVATVPAAAKPKAGEPARADKPRKTVTERVGLVLKVEPNQLTVQIYGKVRSEFVIPVDAQTQVRVDGASATLADIRPGMQVVISPPSGPAQRVLADKVGKKGKKDKDKSPDTMPAAK